MFTVIHPFDGTTSFLQCIYTMFRDGENDNKFEVIKFTDNSAILVSVKSVKSIPKNSLVIYLGHGESRKLFGVEENGEIEKSFINSNEMIWLKTQRLFLLACRSNELFTSSRQRSEIAECVAFNNIPTSMFDVSKIPHLSKENILEQDLENFRGILSDCLKCALEMTIFQEGSLYQLYLKFRLMLAGHLNKTIIDKSDKNLALLINETYSGVKFYYN